MLGIAVWSAVDVALMAGGPAGLRQYLVALMLAGVSAALLGLTALPRVLADPTWRPRRGMLWLLVEPALVVLAAVLPQTAPRVFDQALLAADPARLSAGPLFLAHTLYSYVLLGSALLLLVRRRRATVGTFRRQASVLLLSAVPSVLVNVVAVVLESRGDAVDPTPLGFLVTGLVA